MKIQHFDTMSRRIPIFPRWQTLLIFILSTIFISSRIGNTQPGGWVIDDVESAKFSEMTDRYLRTDTSGFPHMTYGGVQLFYAWYDGLMIRTEVADTDPAVGRHASLALDSEDYPHISYYDAGNKALKYAYKDICGWYTEIVDESEFVGKYTSIDLDSNGYPHISYYDEGNHDLKYTYKDGAGWHHETVDSDGIAGEYTSIALDGTDRVHISYYSRSNKAVQYAIRNESGWTVELVDIEQAKDTSIALEDSIPHISYTCVEYCDIKHAVNNGTGWTIHNFPYSGEYSSIEIDSNGGIHISYVHNGSHCYLYYNGASWEHSCEFHNDATYVGCSSIALDESEQPYIAFIPNKFLRVAYRVGSDWQYVDVDSTDSGYVSYTSIALDQEGFPHITCSDFDESRLYYAYCSPLGWEIEIVDELFNEYYYLYYSSIAIDDAGFPHISYYDSASDDLKYAYKDVGGWHIEIVDWAGDVGMYTSIELDDSGHPHISYCDVDGERLKYATKGESGWVLEIVDEDDGLYTALSLDSDGYPHISYRVDSPYFELRYAVKDGTGWSTEVADGQNGGGYFSSIDVDPNNLPHISHFNQTTSCVRYAHKSATGWVTETIDSAPPETWLMGFTAMAVDGGCDAHVAYYRGWPRYDLNYAHRTNDVWYTETVEAQGAVGYTPSIALDAQGLPHVSSINLNSRTIRYARMQGSGGFMNLTWSVQDSQLQLSWSAVLHANSYWIYGASDQPHFEPGLSPGFQYRLDTVDQATTSWVSPYPTGDTLNNWTYIVLAVDAIGLEIMQSNRVGEFDVSLDIR